MPSRVPRAPSSSANPVHPPVVRSANVADLAFVVALQKAHAAALGFLPRAALKEKIRKRQVLVARMAGERLGFLHRGSLARPEVRIFQIAVTTASTGKGVGRALVERLLGRAGGAGGAGAAGVSLRCLSFLDANRFWRALGFRLHATERGAKGTLNVWVRRIGRTSDRGAGSGRFTFASRVHPCPGCGSPTVDTWVRGARRLTLCPGCVAAAAMN